jgi:hypothetical protein
MPSAQDGATRTSRCECRPGPRSQVTRSQVTGRRSQVADRRSQVCRRNVGAGPVPMQAQAHKHTCKPCPLLPSFAEALVITPSNSLSGDQKSCLANAMGRIVPGGGGNYKGGCASHLPPATCHLPPATCHLPPATCRLPPAACHLPPAQAPQGACWMPRWPMVRSTACSCTLLRTANW